MVVPLHVKSHYSLGYGTAAPGELVDRARHAGLPALALTDLENLYGQIEFHHLCRHRGLRPVTGVELRPGFEGRVASGGKRGRLVLLARDREGYESLCRVISRRRAGRGRAASGRAGDPVDALGRDTRGLFVLSDDPAVLERLLESRAVDPACLRALLVRPAPSGAAEEALRQAAGRHGLPLVADPDVVTLDPADHGLHVLQLAVARNATVAEVRRSGIAEPAERRFAAPAELAALFRDVPQAVEESRRVADACDLDLGRAEPVLPRLALPSGETAASHLARICEERLARGRAAGTWAGPEYDRRLREELGRIARLGFDGYFLVVEEIVRCARERGIRVAGRGSAAGSLAVHLLGVTDVDPVARGLLFERFLHARRRDLPDIDIDLCSRRRDELIDWVHARFGEANVAMVCAHVRFQRRSAYREGLKALGMPLAEVERFCRRLPPQDLEGVADLDGAPVPAAGWVGAGRHAGRGAVPAPPPGVPSLPERYRIAGALLERLVGKPRHVSVHPGGVVIADRAIERYVPLERAAKGVLVAQYDMHSIQHTGLVKIDLLGNHFLSELQETLRSLAQSGEAGSQAATLLQAGPGSIPEADPPTVEALDRGDTIGCFQLESPAIRSLLRQIPIRGLSDCIAALALVRPGAASGDAKQAFIRRANGEEAPDYLHPALEPHLRETHGILLYEEDILHVLSILGGITLEQADELRSGIEESQGEPEELERLEKRFFRLATENGIGAPVARTAWQNVVKFVAYSFSKAHASSYGLLGYQAAYLKTHWPVEFGCAVLNHHGGMYPLRTLAAAVQRWGVVVLGPCVNRSAAPCTVETAGSGAVRVGLGKLKRLSRRTLWTLLASRRSRGPFRDLADLLERVPMSRREVEALVLSGACDGLPPLSSPAYPFAHQAALAWLRGGLPRGRDPAGLAAAVSELPRVGGGADPERLDAYRKLVRIQNELRFLEMHVSEHPMRVLRVEAERNGCVTTCDAARRVGEDVRVAGIVAAMRRVATKDRGVMQFVTVEDEEGTLEAVLFPPAYREIGDAITTPGPFLLAGRVSDQQGDVHLNVWALRPFHERRRAYGVRAAPT